MVHRGPPAALGLGLSSEAVTKEATQFTLLRRVLPPGAFENGGRRAFKVEAKGEAQPLG